MQRATSLFSLFNSESKKCDLFNSNKNDIKTLVIALDPNIFFVSHRNQYIVHPVIQYWLDSIKVNHVFEQLHIYLLTDANAPYVSINIGNENNQRMTIPIQKNFFKLLDTSSLAYIFHLWKGSFEYTFMDRTSTTGISNSSDHYCTIPDELIVITADTNLADFYTEKNITVVLLDLPNKPIMTKAISPETNVGDIEIYCDFDGTLFDINSYCILKRIGVEENTSQEVKNIASELLNDNSFFMKQEPTINLLQQLSKHTTFLLTQRSYKSDSKEKLYGSALNFVKRINSDYSLSIQACSESFLDAHKQLKINNIYNAKIVKIYQISLAKPEHKRPKQILLIDDDINELYQGAKIAPSFAALGIELNLAFIMHPAYYSHEFLTNLHKKSYTLYTQIKQAYDENMQELTNAFKQISYKQTGSLNSNSDTISTCYSSLSYNSRHF